MRVQVEGEARDARNVQALEEEIRRSPRVRALLGGSAELGRPGTSRRVYYYWQGIHWVIASLADIGYPTGDEFLYPLRDRLLELWLGPSYYREFDARTRAEANRVGVPRMQGRYRRCASQQGNALYSLTKLGLLDQRADALVERLLHWQWEDGGWNCARDPTAATSFFKETLLPMLGLALHGRRTGRTASADAARRAAEVFLRRRLFKRVRDARIMDPAFVELHYPLYYHYDFLHGLQAMGQLGMLHDTRCADALDLLEQKWLPGIGWPAERRYYKGASSQFQAGADYVDWGGSDSRRMNPWVTADALSALVAAGRVSF